MAAAEDPAFGQFGRNALLRREHGFPNGQSTLAARYGGRHHIKGAASFGGKQTVHDPAELFIPVFGREHEHCVIRIGKFAFDAAEAEQVGEAGACIAEALRCDRQLQRLGADEFKTVSGKRGADVRKLFCKGGELPGKTASSDCSIR